MLLLVAGAGVLIYPTAASSVTRVEYAAAATRYTTSVATIPVEARNAELAAAHAYNDGLRETLLTDAFSDLSASNSVDDDPYWSTLTVDEEGVMGRLVIPSISLHLPIYHGTSEDTLSRGVGHLRGTALPVGGEGTHAVLSGHNGIPGSELFSRINELKVGDRIQISSFGAEMAYSVVETAVVEPSDTKSLHPRDGHDLVTLVTCTPTGVNSHRLLVTAERITAPAPRGDVAVVNHASFERPTAPAARPSVNETDWARPMALTAVTALLALAAWGVIVVAFARRRTRRRTTHVPAIPNSGD